MVSPDRDQSIEHEPHLRGDTELDPSEQRAASVFPAPDAARDEKALHSVWDEPALSNELAGADERADKLTYARWLSERTASCSWGKSWRVTILVVLGAGVWAILGSLVRELATTFSSVNSPRRSRP